ncbi:MAG: hypothetical protein K2X55_29765 [Burkholderiaceae bacterium]|nr:hypothetical protein [Burkholderiaceae bacterium]
MPSYLFASTSAPIVAASLSLETLQSASKEQFAVELAGDDELTLLMGLLGIELSPPTLLSQSHDFAALFDYSSKKLPNLSLSDFDLFYGDWARSTCRNINMDEYGQLMFLRSYAGAWNRMSSRFILREKSSHCW